MTNERVIYSKRLAFELRKQGFVLLRTDINKNFPQFDVYIFQDDEKLQDAINAYSASK